MYWIDKVEWHNSMTNISGGTVLVKGLGNQKIVLKSQVIALCLIAYNCSIYIDFEWEGSWLESERLSLYYWGTRTSLPSCGYFHIYMRNIATQPHISDSQLVTSFTSPKLITLTIFFSLPCVVCMLQIKKFSQLIFVVSIPTF